MTTLNLIDVVAFAWFLIAWIGYSFVIERTAKGRGGLNALMNSYRDEWMQHMLGRDGRIVDAQVSAALQNGTAFFASTSLIAIGGTLSLLRAPEAVLPVIVGAAVRHDAVARIVGNEDDGARHHLRLRVLQVRLVVPAVQLFRHPARRGAAAERKDTPEARTFAHRAARICADAGQHFNRGQRAFFFALGYLGWFLGPVPLALTTLAVLIVMWRRQFASVSRRAFEPGTTAPR